jgi:hypothetical protein
LETRSDIDAQTSRDPSGSSQRVGSFYKILRPIQSFPQSLKSLRIIGFAFFLDGGVAESAYRGTQTFDRVVPHPERFRQSMFQISPSASKALWAAGGMTTFPLSERTKRSLCSTFQARNRLCFEASSSSSKSWIALGVIDIGASVHTNTYIVKNDPTDCDRWGFGFSTL